MTRCNRSIFGLMLAFSVALSACRMGPVAVKPAVPKHREESTKFDPAERACTVSATLKGASTFLLLSNPFSRGGNTIGEVLPNVPPGSRVYKFVNGIYQINTLDDLVTPAAWTNATMLLEPGEGFFLEVPQGSGSSITVEFRGLAPDSFTEVSRELPAGQRFVLVGSKLGRLDVQPLVGSLGYPVQPGDRVYQFQAESQTWRIDTFDDFDLVWLNAEPRLHCGQGVFISRANLVAATWVEQKLANQPPIADAGADRVVRVGEPISLNGAGSSDPDGFVVEYYWSFGDGNSTQGAQVSHAYATPGTYQLSLTVIDNQGAMSTDTAVITVEQGGNQPPIANAGPDQTVYVGETVFLDGSRSVDPDGFIKGYIWDFDDGRQIFGRETYKTYTVPGTYIVTLRVIDHADAISMSDTVSITVISGNRPPIANAGPDITTPGRVPVAISALGSWDPDGSIVSYSWDFGDGQTGVGWSTSHVYFNAGVYTARLTVTDNQGATATDTAIVTVTPNNLSPIARALQDLQVVPATDLAVFDGTLSSDSDGWISSYEWIISGVRAVSGRVALYRFPGPGNYEVVLRVTDNEGGVSTDTFAVSVVPAPLPAAPSNLVANVVSASQIDLTWNSNESGDVRFVLDRKGPGDADFVAIRSGSLGFSNQNLRPSTDYSYRVRAVNAAGYSGYSNVVSVRTPASCTGTLDPESLQMGYSGGTTSFSVTVGSTCSYAVTSDKTYVTIVGGSNRVGSQVIQLSVGANSSSTARTANISVAGKVLVLEQAASGANLAPLARFTAPETVPIGTLLSLSAENSRDPDGTIASYVWDFGDGTTLQGARVSHAYAAAREYLIRLTVTDNRGASSTRAVQIVATTQATRRLEVRTARALADTKSGTSTSQLLSSFTDALGNAFFGGSNSYHPYLEKISPTGERLWRAFPLGEQALGQIRAIAVDPSGKIAVAGWFEGTAHVGGVSSPAKGKADAFLMQLSAAGEVLWWRQIGGSDDDGVSFLHNYFDVGDMINAIAVDPADSSIVVVGQLKNNGSSDAGAFDLGAGSDRSGPRSLFIARYSSQGRYEGSKVVSGQYVIATGVVIGLNGAILVSGNFKSSAIDLGLGPIPASGVVAMSEFFSFLAHFDRGMRPIWVKSFLGLAISRMAGDGQGDVILRGFRNCCSGAGSFYGVTDVARGKWVRWPEWDAVPVPQNGVLGKFSGATGELLWAMNFVQYSQDISYGVFSEPLVVDRNGRITFTALSSSGTNGTVLNAGLGWIDFNDPVIGYASNKHILIQLESDGTPRITRAMPFESSAIAARGDGRLMVVVHQAREVTDSGITYSALRIDGATFLAPRGDPTNDRHQFIVDFEDVPLR